MSESVARLGQVGLTIGEELDTQARLSSLPAAAHSCISHRLSPQGKMLDELEEDVDGTTTRLGAAQVCLIALVDLPICGH